MSIMFFYFLKIIFNISTSERSKKYKPHSILTKKKKLKFDKIQVETAKQPLSCAYNVSPNQLKHRCVGDGGRFVAYYFLTNVIIS